MEIADEIIVLSDGKVEKQGTREEVLPTLIGTQSAVAVCKRLE